MWLHDLIQSSNHTASSIYLEYQNLQTTSYSVDSESSVLPKTIFPWDDVAIHFFQNPNVNDFKKKQLL